MKMQVVYEEGMALDTHEKEVIQKYLERLDEKYSNSYGTLPVTIGLDDAGDIRIDYAANGVKFERIRRITGYLVGTIDRWNDAKQAEEHDRVKHEKPVIA